MARDLLGYPIYVFLQDVAMKSKGKVSGKVLRAPLEAHPGLMARVERILDLVENTYTEVA
jgi:hypothetical protein